MLGHYDPTIEDVYRKYIEIDDNSLLIDILDTTEQEDFLLLRTSWIRKDGFILVYSIDQICEVYQDNKIDLDEPETYNRKVTYEEGESMAI